MKLKEQLHYKKIEYFSEIYDKSFSTIINTNKVFYNAPLFIFGSGRNGSTLISSILNNHSRIFIPPENNIIPFSIKYWHLNPFKSWETKLDKIFNELEKPSMWNVDFTDLKLKLKSLNAEKRNVNTILSEIYYAYGLKYKNRTDFLWGDKTPSNTVYAHLMKTQFVNSKILFLIRDPRAVISSLLDANYNYYHNRIDYIIWRWKSSLRKYESIKCNDPNSIMLIKYEELVLKPSMTVKEILNWLEFTFEVGMLDNTAQNMSLLGVQAAVHHQNLKKPITSSYIYKWKTKLDDDMVLYIEKKLRKEMICQNYK